MHRAVVTFGINALYGRRKSKNGVWVGTWDSSNALDFMKYTISKGYEIDSWEFGTLSVNVFVYCSVKLAISRITL